MSENPIEQIYTERLSELIKLCRIILSGEMIEGLEAEDMHRQMKNSFLLALPCGMNCTVRIALTMRNARHSLG